MKAVLTSVSVVVLGMFAGQAYGAGYGAAGCGLGSIVLGAKPGFMQVFAATTNGTSASQTFGITSGTSNCADKAGAAAEEGGEEGEAPKKDKKTKKKKNASIIEQRDFVTANLSTLKKEAAQGNGDTLAALSSTLGCDAAVFPQFAANIKGHHGQIFAKNDANAVLINVKAQVGQDEMLAQGCEVGVY